MKMKHLKTFFSMLILIAAVSCNKAQQAGDGHVSFGVYNDDSVVDVTRSAVSSYTTLPQKGDFSIDIKNASLQTVWKGNVGDWDPATPLPAGNYSVTAWYGDIEEEGFDKPYFTGSASFAITGGETKAVSVPVSLGNTVVMVSCTEAFRNYYKNYTFKLTRNNAEIVTFAKGETKAAFVDGYKFTLEGVLEAETKTYEFTRECTNLDPATAYTFLFDVTSTGGASITISFNHKVETVELGDYELND